MGAFNFAANHGRRGEQSVDRTVTGLETTHVAKRVPQRRGGLHSRVVVARRFGIQTADVAVGVRRLYAVHMQAVVND